VAPAQVNQRLVQEDKPSAQKPQKANFCGKIVAVECYNKFTSLRSRNRRSPLVKDIRRVGDEWHELGTHRLPI
jgi:hypothetical protein